MGKINQGEYEKLKEARADGYEWIARDADGVLYTYDLKPEALDTMWVYEFGDAIRLAKYEHLFRFIRWVDSEPYNIAELIEEYELGKILLAMAEEEVVLEIESKNEEREDKKDIELLKEQIEIEIRMWDGAESGWAECAVDKIFNLIDKFLLSDKGGNCDDKKD